MGSIPFVTVEQGNVARRMEEQLLSGPRASGILFVGVSVHPTLPGEEPIYYVWVGCSRKLNEDIVPSLVKMSLGDDILAGREIKVEVHRGCIRT